MQQRCGADSFSAGAGGGVEDVGMVVTLDGAERSVAWWSRVLVPRMPRGIVGDKTKKKTKTVKEGCFFSLPAKAKNTYYDIATAPIVIVAITVSPSNRSHRHRIAHIDTLRPPAIGANSDGPTSERQQTAARRTRRRRK